MQVNLPGAILELPTLSEQEEGDIAEFATKQPIDIIGLSLTRKASDIEYMR